MGNVETQIALKTIQRLHQQAERFKQLEKKYPELRKEREVVQALIADFEAMAQNYFELKADWEWFFEHSLDMKCIIDLKGYFTRVNPAICKTLGFSEEETLSKPIFHFIHPDDIEPTSIELQNLRDGITTVEFENRYRDRWGRWRWISWCCPPYTSDSKQLYAIARDVTESKRTQEELLYQAMHDPLTDLLNRASFDYEMDLAMARCGRNSELQLYVFSIDLNGFKSINDTYGHLAGDHVLKELSRRFIQNKRKNDLIFRIGGDEFVWLTEGFNMNPESLITRIGDCFSEPIKYNDISLAIQGSIGYACCQGDCQSIEALLTQADQSMYRHKRSSKK